MRDLGEGAFAKVVECQVTRDGRPEPCAVKLLKPALFDSTQDVTDFIKEGVVLRKIKHPCASFVSLPTTRSQETAPPRATSGAGLLLGTVLQGCNVHRACCSLCPEARVSEAQRAWLDTGMGTARPGYSSAAAHPQQYNTWCKA